MRTELVARRAGIGDESMVGRAPIRKQCGGSGCLKPPEMAHGGGGDPAHGGERVEGDGGVGRNRWGQRRTEASAARVWTRCERELC